MANVRRGLFRLWVIFAVLFVLATAAVSYTDVRNAFFWSDPPQDFITDLPVDCSAARGAPNTDYRTFDGLCWYAEPKFRTLYPEYRDLREQELAERIYAKAGRPLKEIRPWTLIAARAGIGFGVPLVVLAFGWSIAWAFSGFHDSGLPRETPK